MNSSRSRTPPEPHPPRGDEDQFHALLNRLMIDEESKMKRNSIGIVMGMILREIQHREKAKQQAEEA